MKQLQRSLADRGTSLPIEIRAGITTFLTMAYILFVNPVILAPAFGDLAGETLIPQLMTATALAAAFGTLIMGLWAKFPFAQAPGMGLNAYFTYTVVLGSGTDWRTALGAVFISGILFTFISLVGLREALVNALPNYLKAAVTAGIGCFLATIGLVNAGLVVDHPATLVTLGDLSQPAPLIALAGLLLISVLLVLKIRGAVLIGILAASLTAVLSGAAVFNGQPFTTPQNGFIRAPIWPTEIFLQLDILHALSLGMISVVFTLLFVDFFDSAGSLIGLANKAGYLDQKGRLPNAKRAFTADALATAVGALFGSSTTTTYIESASGIEDGGKTGLTSVVTALCFLLALFFWPLAAMVPPAATAPPLIVVGAMMMFAATAIDWHDYHQGIPAFLTILCMPLTYSISNGIGIGILAAVGIHLFSGQAQKISVLLYIIAALVTLKFIFL